MARSFTLKQLRTRLRQETDTVNDEHLQNDELNDFIMAAAAETVDHIISSGLSEKYIKSTTFNTVSGTSEYNLQSATYIPDLDFYKLAGVYVNEGSGHFRPLPRINPSDVQTYRPPQSAVPVKLYYIPFATKFKDTNGNWDDESTFDGINGWEEHLICAAAIKIKRKKDEGWSDFRQQKAEIEQRMAFMGNTDWAAPARVTRRRRRTGEWYPYNNQLSAYAIRGDKLELYYSYPWVP